MAVKIPFSVQKSILVNQPIDAVYELVSNVPESVSHFPDLEDLQAMGDNSFKWVMKPMGTERLQVQTVYACQYVSDDAAQSVQWNPIKGEGNAQVSGSWTLEEAGDGTQMTIETQGEIEVPIPRLMSKIAKPVVSMEFAKLIEGYLNNLQTRLA